MRRYREAVSKRADADSPLDLVTAIFGILRSDFEPDLNAVAAAARVAASDTDTVNRNQVAAQMEALLPTVPPPDPKVMRQVEKILERNHRQFIRQSQKYIEKSRRALLREMRKIAVDYYKQGASAGALEQALIERLQVSQSRARRIARDQVGKYFGALTETRHRSVGANRYEWQTAGDERVRSSHADRDGRVYSYDDPPFDGNPGEPINCRCTAIPVFD